MAGIVDQALLVMYLVLLLNVAIGIGISLMYLGVIGWIFSLLFYQGKMFASISATVVHQQNGIIVSKKRQYTVILSLLFAVLSCTFRYCLSNISVEICSTMLYSVTHLYPEQAIDAFFCSAHHPHHYRWCFQCVDDQCVASIGILFHMSVCVL